MAYFGILEELSKDDVYKMFLTDDFDVKAVTSSAVQLVAVTEHLAKLSAGISLLDKELHQQVANHYADLLSQATGIETLETVLNAVYHRIQALLSSAERLKQAVLIPFNTVSSQIAMLVRLQTACDLLRRIIRMIQLCSQLKNQLSINSSDMVKAAQLLNELEYLGEGVDFSGVQITEKHLELTRSIREQIYIQANDLLMKGIEMQDHSSVETAVQVFHGLQLLTPMVQKLMEDLKKGINRHVLQSLDVRFLSHQALDNSQKIYGPGRAAIPLAGNTAAFRSSLWTSMEGLMKKILVSCHQAQLLQNVLLKSESGGEHAKHLDESEMHGKKDIMLNFWEAVTKILTEEFSHAANESTYIRQAFEVEYPKLLCMFNSLMRGLFDIGFDVIISQEDSENLSNFCDKTANQDLSSRKSPEDALRNSLLPFESAYLSRCLSRLTDSVNVIYASEEQNVPTVEDVEGIVKVIKSELIAASVDSILLLKVARNLSETINYFVEKSQYLVCTDESAVQISDMPSSNQIVNSRVVHLLHFFQTKIMITLKECQCSEEIIHIVLAALKSVTTLINIVVEPLIQSVCSAMKAIIIGMHKEDFSMQSLDTGSKTFDAPYSLYMKEFEDFVHRSQLNYFSLYPDCDAIVNGIQSLASHSVEFFVRHASLIRPIGDGGKMRLAADCAQMEMAISPWCQRIRDLGRVYKLLRSFRPLLFQTASHIAQAPALGNLIPYSLVIHLLYARAPPELKSPYVVAGMTLEEYSFWLDNHPSEKERLVMIKGSLEKYVGLVKQKQDKEFCSVYPVMIYLLQKGMEIYSH